MGMGIWWGRVLWRVWRWDGYVHSHTQL